MTEYHEPSGAQSAPLPISVIIPAYNRAGDIGRALESVARQLPSPPAEVVVVDDASDDDTAAVASGLGAKVVRHETNLGPGAARNSGIRAATYPWVAFLDSDDEWLQHHLNSLWTARNGHALISGSCLVLSETEGSQPIRVIGPLTRTPRVLSSGLPLLFPHNFVAQSAVLLKRDLALQVGGYEETMRHSEDLHLWLRLLQHGSGVALPDVTVKYRMHDGQAISNAKAMRLSHLAVLRQAKPAGSVGRVDAKWRASDRWDDLRSAQRERDWLDCIAAALRLLSPPALLAVSHVLLVRYRARRLAGRFSADGSPSYALLPSSDLKLSVNDPLQRVIDLRAATPFELLASLVLHPCGSAVGGNWWQRPLLRFMGVIQVAIPE